MALVFASPAVAILDREPPGTFNISSILTEKTRHFRLLARFARLIPVTRNSRKPEKILADWN
jgi:hypothetical protein